METFDIWGTLKWKDAYADDDLLFLRDVRGVTVLFVERVKYVLTHKAEIESQKADVDRQIAYHQSRLAELRCGETRGTCRLEGSWEETTTEFGTTTWVISGVGIAKQYGVGNATGTASLNGRTLHIDWSTSTGYSGYYEWPLNESCTSSSVKGTLKFKAPRTDSLDSTVKRK